MKKGYFILLIGFLFSMTSFAQESKKNNIAERLLKRLQLLMAN